MVARHLIHNMQWETKGRFSGQVKPAGIEKSMSWKMGSVHFDYEAVTGSWMAKLFFRVNPTKVCQQVKIGQSDNLDVKCGRLMIENKKGDGIHIKLASSDIPIAKLLVSKIKNSMVCTPTGSRAEVGLTPQLTLSNHKGSENVSPFMNEDSMDLSLFQFNNEKSPERRPGVWTSKKTPPMKTREHNPAPKRRLELFSPEKDDWKNDGGREKKLCFTGMKDYSKRNHNGDTCLSVTNGLGAKSFYGAQNSLTTSNSYGNISANRQSVDRSPVQKRPKLSVSNYKKMPEARIYTPPKPKIDDGTQSRDLQVENVPRRHLRAGETIGFINLGNTCFLNSPLQCLSYLEPFSLDIQMAVSQYGLDLNQHTLTRQLYHLMKFVRKRDVCPERVREILTKLRADMDGKFPPNTQQDAHELLSEVLNRLDEEAKAFYRLVTIKSVQTTDLDDSTDEEEQTVSGAGGAAAAPLSPNSIPTPTDTNFRWSYRTEIYFHECKTHVVSSQTEREITLMLAFDSTMESLQECIDKYFESTEVEMKCEKCGKDEKATITRKIVKLPRVFILNLLRYHHAVDMAAMKKVDDIRVPSYISVCGYCTEDAKRPLQSDPVFMLDRDATLGLHWLNQAERCRCPKALLPPVQRPPTPPSRPKVLALPILKLRSPDRQTKRSSKEIEDVEKLILELDQRVPGYEYAAGQNPQSGDSPGTNRTGSPIETNIDDIEYQDSDRSTPIYGEDLYYEDISDSSPPPLVGEEVLVQTSSQPAYTQKPAHTQKPAEKGLAVSGRSQRRDLHSSTPSHEHDSSDVDVEDTSPPRNKPKKREDTFPPHNKPKKHEDKSPPRKKPKKRLSDSTLFSLADFVTANVIKIKGNLLNRKAEINLSIYYEGAKAVLAKISHETQERVQKEIFSTSPETDTGNLGASGLHFEVLMLIVLLKKFLAIEDDMWAAEIVIEETLVRVIEQLVATRMAFGLLMEKCVFDLIEDLGLYMCSRMFGVTDSVTDEIEATVRSLIALLDEDKQKTIDSTNTGGYTLVRTEALNTESHSQVETDTSKKFVHFKKGFCSYFPESSESDKTSQNVGTDKSEEERRGDDEHGKFSPVSDENIWKDNWDEENTQDSFNGSSSRTGYLHVPLDRQLIHGKDVNLYSETDLQKIDHMSLTDDEMMIYAQALSRFEYEKEQSAQVGPEQSVQLESEQFVPVELECCGAFEEATDLHVSSENDYTLKNPNSPTAEVEEVLGGSRTTVKTDKSNASMSPRAVSELSSQKFEVENSLSCPEDPSTLDGDIASEHIPVALEVSCETSSRSPPVDALEQRLLSGVHDQSPTKHSISSGSMDQTDTQFCDVQTDEASNSPSDNKSVTSEPEPLEVEESVDPKVKSPLKRTARESIDKNADYLANPEHSASKKEYSFTPTKPNNLVKTRDYVRLKSPVLSPKKRILKAYQSKSGQSQHHFGEDEKREKISKSSTDDESPSSDDISSLELLNTSLEVNVDDASFLDNINSCSFADPSALSYSTPFSTPKASTDTTESSHSSRSGRISTTSFMPSTVEPGLQTTLADVPMEASPSARTRKSSTSEMQENVEPEQYLGTRPKTFRQSSASEEKENMPMPTDSFRDSRLRDIELGKADLSYRLVGVVDHVGETQYTGHYTAYAFHMIKQKWYHLNDLVTRMVTEEEVQNSNLQTGYLFFYMDKDIFNDYKDKANSASMRPPS